MRGDGDGWVQCDAGHRHWGLFGAAGVLIADGKRAILQHRAPWTHEGGTWGLPGGARDSHEDAVTTALREATEEAAIPASAIEPVAMRVDDHGGWSYTTVLARPRSLLSPHAANAESTEIRWWTESEVDALPLHQGLAATWPYVRQPPRRLSVVIDARAINELGLLDLIGPAGDSRYVRRGLGALTRDGIGVQLLPAGIDHGGVSSLLPSIVFVTDGPQSEPPDASLDGWWRQGLEVHPAEGDASAVVARSVGSGLVTGQIVVVTTDARLGITTNPAIVIVEAAWLIALLQSGDFGAE